MKSQNVTHRGNRGSTLRTDTRERGAGSWHTVSRGYRPKSTLSPKAVVPPKGGTGAVPAASTGSKADKVHGG